MLRSLAVLFAINIFLISCNGTNPVQKEENSSRRKKESTLNIKVIARPDIDTLSIPKEQLTDGIRRCHYLITFENIGNTDTCIFADSAGVIDIYKVRTHDPVMNEWGVNYSFTISNAKACSLPPHSKSYFILPLSNPKDGVWDSLQFIMRVATCKTQDRAFIKILYSKDTTFSSLAGYADRTK